MFLVPSEDEPFHHDSKTVQPMPTECTFSIAIDCLNQDVFLEIIQNGIDLCATAEQTCAAPTATNLARLQESASAFREWFKNG